MARVRKGSHSFTCTARVHLLTEWTIPAFVFPAKAGLIYRLRRDGRLSWPWLGYAVDMLNSSRERDVRNQGDPDISFVTFGSGISSRTIPPDASRASQPKDCLFIAQHGRDTALSRHWSSFLAFSSQRYLLLWVSSAQCVSAVSHAIWRTMHKLFGEAAALRGGRLRFVNWSGKRLQPSRRTVTPAGVRQPAGRPASERARVLLHRLNPVLIDMDELWIWTTTAAAVDAAAAQNCHLSYGRWSMPTGGWWTRPWRAVPGSLHRPTVPLTCTPTVSTYRTPSTNIAGARARRSEGSVVLLMTVDKRTSSTNDHFFVSSSTTCRVHGLDAMQI